MSLQPSQAERCSFCGRSRAVGDRLVDGPGHAICSDCIAACNEIIADSESAPAPRGRLPSPADLVAHLNQWVVGQETAKRRLAVSVYNHYKRVGLPGTPVRADLGDIELGKSNVLMLGPTGSGKTHLVRTLAKVLRVPLHIADATALTEAGYVGEDVQSIVSGLYEAADNDVEACERGIIFLDEIDKLAKRSNSDSSGRDVGGEGVQHALLKLLEGHEVKLRRRSRPTEVTIDTSGVLFVLGGAFIGLDSLVQRRLGRRGVGFGGPTRAAPSPVPSLPDTTDLLTFGLIPELIGRIGAFAQLQPLGIEELTAILTEPRDSLVRQYQLLLRMDGVRLRFTRAALEAVARESQEAGLGARGLRSVMERVLLPWMFELPSRDDVRELWITAEAVRNEAEPDFVLRDRTG